MTDEGKYWETGDENLLHEIFMRYTHLLDSFKFAVENVPKNQTESREDYFRRLTVMIKDNDKDSE